MTGSVKELAEELAEFAREQDAKADGALGPYVAGYRNEAKLIREAAAKLVEMEAALKPFANFDSERAGPDHQRVMAMVQTPPHYEYTKSIGLEGVTVRHFRAAARALSEEQTQ